MKRIGYIIAVIVLGALIAPGAVQAEQPSWKYIEAGANDIDVDGPGGSGDGYFIGASFSGKSFHAFGRWSDNSTDENLDVSRWYAGAGWHGLLGENADFFGELAYADADIGPVGGSGYFARAGVRWRPISLVELGASTRFEDLGDIDSDLVWEANAMVYVWRLSLGLSYEIADSVDTFTGFARLNF
jgi:hypothetical protein